MTYKYRIFSCGVDANENKITVRGNCIIRPMKQLNYFSVYLFSIFQFLQTVTLNV